jgi:uncharacterized membrane protein YoaK (UPF0700 family)
MSRGTDVAGVLAGGLTIVSGSIDAISFMRLGKVFSSVMTGNVVLLGIAAGNRDAGLAGHVAVAVAGYVIGTAIGAPLVARAHAGSGEPGRPVSVWPERVSVVVAVETCVLMAVLGGWLAVSGRPQGASQILLLAGTSAAMGMQSAAVRAIRVPGLISTTYLTSTLTGVVAALVTREEIPWRGAAMLLALFIGAGAGAGLVVTAASLAVVLPCVLLVATLAVAATPAFRTASRAAVATSDAVPNR